MAFDPSKFTIPGPKPLPVILLLDVSGSMEIDDNIGKLNKAVEEMIHTFANQKAREIEIQVAAITFGAEVKLHLSYTPAPKVNWTTLAASGQTPISTAVEMAKAMVEDKAVTPSRAYRPAVVLVSDGAPVPDNQPWREAIQAFAQEGRSSKCERFALGIGSEADESVLQAFIEGSDHHQVFHADDAAKIADFFKFVTMSVTARMQSVNPNQVVSPESESKTTGTTAPASSEPEPDPYW